jgi:formate C-acetyltransferase
MEELESFDDFLEAFFEQIRHRVRQCRRNAEQDNANWEGRLYDPFASCMVHDCLETGRDIFQGGARYGRRRAIGGYGLGTTADSLAAIRQFVYEERKLSLEELFQALQSNFEGYPELQRMLDTRTPRYGNDLEQVDELARRVFEVYADSVHALNDGSLPGKFCTSVFSYNHHVYGAETIIATPDGRGRAEPMSDAIGPSQGKDVKGPTNLVNSVTRLPHEKVTGAYALNVKFAPDLVRGQEGSAALKAIIKTYFARGGVQMQVNFVDTDELKDAQVHPERHANLVVRVAGYSEYFTCLDHELQCEIIKRTAHSA